MMVSMLRHVVMFTWADVAFLREFIAGHTTARLAVQYEVG
jgi:hypothetical protein